ncbi:hypothetical protein ABTX35_17690 [Streptomyces sp. NPDC096080]|uniref:hypothetical protein n=1 Tax=Streptomyces sp. NPDC096080 TaxID=3156693 RepID=UPI003325A71D
MAPSSPPGIGPRLHLHRQHFDLVVAGTKAIEVRVKYSHLADLATGEVIRFRIKGTDEDL